MGIFEGILICTDLDGTLLNSAHRVSEENLKAIRHFEQEGGKFTFITGRPPVCVTEIYETVLPNAPFGCFNGGGIYDAENQCYVYTQELRRDVCELICDALEAIPTMGVQVNTFGRILFCRDNAAMERFRRITGVPKLLCDLDEIEDPFAKIVFSDLDVANVERLRVFLAAHPRASEFDFVRSEKTLYEILPKGINKGSILPHLSRHLSIPLSRTIALGDYDNDVEMLRTAGMGIAVANAIEEAKRAAKRITVSNDEHAVARVIEELEHGEILL